MIYAFSTFGFFGAAFFFCVVDCLTPLLVPFFEMVFFVVAFLGAGSFWVAVAFFGEGFLATFFFSTLGTTFFTTFFGFGADFFVAGLSLYELFTCGYIVLVAK